MKQAYIISRGMEEFASAREQFALIVDRLQSAAVLGMEHGEVEGLISREGTELMRRLLQGHLDVRAAAETREVGVRGADGVVRSHVREGCRRRLGTIFGEVEVRRCGYSAPEEGSLFPLDGELNLPKDSYSHGLRERLAVEVARGSFDEAVRTIETTTGGQVPKRQAEELAAKMSQDFEAFYEDRASRGPEETLDPLVMSEDGKGIVMRKEDLREGTKRAAERDAHQLKTRLSQGEKRNRKRMATVAAVYSIERQVRTPESIMSVEVQKKEEVPKVRARHKRVWASVERTPEQVTEEVFQEARRRDPEGKRPWVMLVDGHEGQLEDIHAAIERHGVEVTLVLDFIHVLEYLWKAAWCFFVPGCQEPGSASGPCRSSGARPAMWPPACGAVPPYATSAKWSVRGSIPARTTSSNTVRCCATTAIWPRVSPLPRGSSKGPAVTSLKTAWTSPGHAGDCAAPRRY
jgi:hypothetical protein